MRPVHVVGRASVFVPISSAGAAGGAYACGQLMLLCRCLCSLRRPRLATHSKRSHSVATARFANHTFCSGLAMAGAYVARPCCWVSVCVRVWSVARVGLRSILSCQCISSSLVIHNRVVRAGVELGSHQLCCELCVHLALLWVLLVCLCAELRKRFLLCSVEQKRKSSHTSTRRARARCTARLES